MNICIPLRGEGAPYDVMDWHNAAAYLFIDSDNNTEEHLTRTRIESSGRPFADHLVRFGTELVICRGMPPMVERIFRTRGIIVRYTDSDSAGEAFLNWQSGKLLEEPPAEMNASACSGACTSCSTASCG